jgi:hypothetical protein
MSMTDLVRIFVPKRSPGFLLVLLGFMSLYLIAGLSDRIQTVVLYLGIAFVFVITLSGIALMFRAETVVSLSNEPSLSVESSDIEQAVGQLGKNYDILRRQVTQGFILAGTFMALGILVILTGSLGDMFGFTRSTSNLTTVAGVIVEVVSGLGLYLFKETFKQLNSTSDKLHEMWKILAAFKKAEELPETLKGNVVVGLIERLVDLPNPGYKASQSNVGQ